MKYGYSFPPADLTTICPGKGENVRKTKENPKAKTELKIWGFGGFDIWRSRERGGNMRIVSQRRRINVTRQCSLCQEPT